MGALARRSLRAPSRLRPGRLAAAIAFVALALQGCVSLLDLHPLEFDDEASDAEANDGPASDGRPGEGDGAEPSCTADLRTSADHCGRCNHSCLGGACVEGACQPVVFADAVAPARELIASRGELFWRTTKGVFKQRTDGGIETRLAFTSQAGDVLGLAVDETDLYYSDRIGRVIVRCPRAGCPSPALVVFALPASDGGLGIGDLAIDQGHVYFAEIGQRPLWRVDRAGADPFALAYPDYAGRVELTASSVLYTQFQQVASVPKDGGTPFVVTDVPEPFGYISSLSVSVTAIHTASTTSDGGEALVTQTPLTGGATTSIRVLPGARGVTADDRYAYVVSVDHGGAPGGVARVPIRLSEADGGPAPPLVLARAMHGGGFALCLDGDALYYADGNYIMRVALP